MAIDQNIAILTVDDYRTMLRIIRNLLKQIGFNNIDDATDGKMAMTKLHSKSYGLIISDWNMSPMNGYDLLQNIRNDPYLKHIPFIMITAESKAENAMAAKHAGVDNYIVKPFNAETLKNKIYDILSVKD